MVPRNYPVLPTEARHLLWDRLWRILLTPSPTKLGSESKALSSASSEDRDSHQPFPTGERQ